LILQLTKIFCLLLICSSLEPDNSKQKTSKIIPEFSLESSCKIFPNKDTLSFPEGINSFISQLNEIIKTKDFNKLLEKVDPDVTVSYGEAIYGKSKFEATWSAANNQELLWQILGQMIILGGDTDQYKNKEAFVFPYTQIDRFYKGVQSDWLNLAVVTEAAVDLVDNTHQEILDTLNYEIVEIIDRSVTGWPKVKTVCGHQIGWVAENKLYSCADYTLVLVRDKKKMWKIKVFSTE
jgi:hypothetical protein